MRRYYDSDYNMNEQAFFDRLEELHNRVEGSTPAELLKIRSALYRLKAKYEESGSRYLECEEEIAAINELIQEDRR